MKEKTEFELPKGMLVPELQIGEIVFAHQAKPNTFLGGVPIYIIDDLARQLVRSVHFGSVRVADCEVPEAKSKRLLHTRVMIVRPKISPSRS